MDLKAIINAVADEADDFLVGISSKSEARTAILAYLSDNYPDLNPGDSARVTSGLLSILDNEGFFDARGPRDVWTADAENERGVE
jgi:hypothetical protein